MSNDNVAYADILFDSDGRIGLRFDDGQIFSMPAPLAAHLGRNLMHCAHEAGPNIGYPDR